MRASVSSDEIASARISCSVRSLKFLATASPPMRVLSFSQYGSVAGEEAGVADGASVAEGARRGTEEAGVAEGVGVAATWTVVPVVIASEGLTITLSDSVTPPRISD